MAEKIIAAVDFDTWVMKPGLAPVDLDFTTKDLIESSHLADGYIALNGTGSPANFSDYENYYSNLKVVFIERLITREVNVDTAILTKIDSDYNLTNTVDPECKMRWFPLGIRNFYSPVLEPAH